MIHILKTSRTAQLFFLLVSGIVLSVAFVNQVSLSSLSVSQIVSQSKVISAKINASQSPQVKVLYKKHKITILNYLSAKVLAASCSELKTLDSSILTGLYNLYPDKNLANPKSTLCEFSSSGVLVASKDLSAHFKTEPGCEADNSCVNAKDFYKTFSCSQSGSSTTKTYCEVEGVYGTPLIVTNKNNKCSESTYGYDEALGFWVNNGCSGVFRMNRVPRVQIPMTLLTWKSHGVRMQYRLDVRKLNGTVQEDINACAIISPDADQNSLSDYEHVFDGVCANNKTVNIDESTSVRVCGVANGTSFHCSDYQKLKKDEAVELTFPTAQIAATTMTGNFERIVNHLGVNVITGWACAEGFVGPVTVNVYAGDTPSTGKLLVSRVANAQSGPPVLAQCKVASGNYRFNISLTDAQIESVRGEKLHVLAVSPLGDASLNVSLPNSGSITVPTASIIGWLESAVIVNGKVEVRGWACAHGVSTSVGVHVYVNGPVGKGQYIGAAQANIAGEAAVNSACATTGGLVGHRFVANLPIHPSIGYGTPVFVHGLSPSKKGSDNLLITDSGKVKLFHGPPPQNESGRTKYSGDR